MTRSDGSSSKKGLQMSCSRVEDCGDSSKGKAEMWGSEVEELSERLKILEEETQIIKEAVFWSLEERKSMMNEICKQFQLLQGYLQPKNHLVIKESFYVNPFEDGRFRKSLPNIQIPDPKPCLLTKELKANALAFQEHARVSN
ncbi:hypothetical protein L484_025726 [Morus notabilis]|uniref:Uncharacterized protein n=1 Tax=Morus notabilis TaxID=981085 RepID=W9R3P4_9ROSA|nr:hypothetical protein L484_025726 [Morus notabilis]